MLHPHLIAHTRPLACAENMVYWRHFRVTLLGSMLLRVEEDESDCFCDEATQVVWFRDQPHVWHQVEAQEDACIIVTERVRFCLREPLAQSEVVLSDGRKVALDNAGNLLGTYRTLDCCDGDFAIPYGGKREQGHTIALENGVLSRNGVAVLDDSASLLLAPDGTVMPRPHPQRDWYLFAYGWEYRQAIQGLYAICGAPPHLPRFALGNWWSRYWAYTQREYLALMDSFAEREIPFTVATVDMDWHPSQDLPDGADGWTGYTWNQTLFPDERAFLQALHARQLHVTLNLHPALGIRWFEKQYPEMARRMGVNPETKETIPFDITNVDFVNAYFDLLHKPYERDGVDFWWIDWQQGKNTAIAGLDPLWSLNHYHSLDIAKEKEQLILSRYAGIGSHRYPLGFSGDTHVTWDTLRYLPYFTATASNAGYTWWSHDIGGHMCGVKDDELFVRFVQFGVFSPIHRLHSSKARTLSKDIAAYPGGRGLIVREFLQLRHAMIPMLYTANCETAEKGLALIEPMYYEVPKEEAAYQCSGQYLFARQMIAAPITEHSDADGLVTTRVWLPEGSWTDFFTGDTYHGGWQQMTRALDTFPLLVKAGGIVVLDGAVKGNSTALPTVLDVHVFAGDGTYTLIEEENGHRALTKFQTTQTTKGQQVVTIQATDAGGILPERGVTLRLRNVMDGSICVLVNGEKRDAYSRQEAGYTLVRLTGLRAQDVCQITIDENATEKQKRVAAMTRIVTEIEGSYDKKETLLNQLCACDTVEAYQRVVAEAGFSKGWTARLQELAQTYPMK